MTTKTAIPLELLDQLLSNYRKPEDLTGRSRFPSRQNTSPITAGTPNPSGQNRR